MIQALLASLSHKNHLQNNVLCESAGSTIHELIRFNGRVAPALVDEPTGKGSGISMGTLLKGVRLHMADTLAVRHGLYGIMALCRNRANAAALLSIGSAVQSLLLTVLQRQGSDCMAATTVTTILTLRGS